MKTRTPRQTRKSDKAESDGTDHSGIFVRNAVEASVRIGLIALLVVLCYEIIRPLLPPVLWGVILAISFYPAFVPLSEWLRGRKILAAGLLTLLALFFIIVPIGVMSVLIVDNLQLLATRFEGGALHLPPPSDTVLSIPLVGKPLHELWSLATQNVTAVLGEYKSELQSMAGFFLKVGAKVGLGLVIAFAAIIVAGILLTQAVPARRAIVAAAERFVGEDGEKFVVLAGNTVRNVAMGVVGVGLIQGFLVGIGLFAAGIPLPGIIVLAVIVLSILQLAPALVVIPVIVYAFLFKDIVTASLFTAWMAPCMLVDNILKPIIMARGTTIPMLVIFVGVMGGSLAHGLNGLFIGPVILALGYSIIHAWIYGVPSAEGTEPAPALQNGDRNSG